jgi:hypothetical protein
MYLHRLVLCFVFIASTLATPRPARAALSPDVYDAVDSVEVNKRDSDFTGSPPTLTVRGVIAGGSAPQSRRYVFNNNSTSTTSQTDGLEAAMHCHRLAVLVMSKPGKFQFAIAGPIGSTANSGCRLMLITP